MAAAVNNRVFLIWTEPIPLSLTMAKINGWLGKEYQDKLMSI
jgi:hypothetical protein